jgi:capsular polysaccharide biosynthesis protein
MTLIDWAWRRLAGRQEGLDEASFERVVLAPEEPFVRERVPMLDGMLDRVTGTDPNTTLDDQLAIARGGPSAHAATIAWHLRDAQVFRHAVYARGMRLVHGRGGARRDAADLLRGVAAMRIDKGLLVANFVTNHWFGEWLLDTNARAVLAQALGLVPIDIEKERPYEHAARYGEILRLPLVPVRHAEVGELVVLQDHGQNAHRRARFQELRRRARARPGKRCDHGVFLVRGRHGQLRLLENEAAAIEWARGIGFHIVDPMALSVDETLAELRDARWIVGVESSAMMHATLVMHPDGAIASIVPPNRFCINLRDYCEAMGLGYALMVAQPGDAGGFRADIREVEATLALAQARYGSEATAAADKPRR